MTQKLLVASASIALLAVSMTLVACSKSSDEEQIRDVIDAAEKAAEERDTSDTLALVAEDYRDARGFGKAELQDYLRAYFLTHPKIELVVRVSEVKIETTNSARVRVELAMVGTQASGGDVASLTGESESLQIEFKRIEGTWKVARVDRVRG